MFPGANAQVYYNEAGEPLGWDYPSDEPYEPDDYEMERAAWAAEAEHERWIEQAVDDGTCCAAGDWSRRDDDSPWVCDYCDEAVAAEDVPEHLQTGPFYEERG